MDNNMYDALRNRFDDARTDEEIARWLKADIALQWVRGAENFDSWFPKMWKAMSAEVGVSPGRLMVWARTARAFPPDERIEYHEYITFDHHVICAHTNAPELWLDDAVAGVWSTRQLRAAIREAAGEPGKCPHLKRQTYCQHQNKCIDSQECEGCLLRKGS